MKKLGLFEELHRKKILRATLLYLTHSKITPSVTAGEIMINADGGSRTKQETEGLISTE